MTVKQQPKRSVAVDADARVANAKWADDKRHAVHCLVVERLFGKQHWARDWVIELCAADPQFVFRLADQPRGYVHFLCVLRMALLESGADSGLPLLEIGVSGGDMAVRAWMIRSSSKKELLKRWLPACPSSILGMLSKLPSRPMAQRNYQRLISALSHDGAIPLDDLRKHFGHVERVRKRDIRLIEKMELLPAKFRSVAAMRCIENDDDFETYYACVRAVQLLERDFEITAQEISRVATDAKAMDALAGWFLRKIAKAPFPPPPWEGDESIRPVRSRSELKAVAERFRNCVMQYVHKVTFGFCYFYVCESTPAVIELINDRFYGWHVGEIEIKENDGDRIAIKKNHPILQSLSNAGFRKLPSGRHFLHNGIMQCFDADC